MDPTFWMGIAVMVAAVGLTASAIAIRRGGAQPRGSKPRQNDATLDLDEERAKGLYQSGWVP